MIYECPHCGQKSLIVDLDKVMLDRDTILKEREEKEGSLTDLQEKREYLAGKIIELYSTPARNAEQLIKTSEQISLYQALIEEVTESINRRENSENNHQ